MMVAPIVTTHDKSATPWSTPHPRARTGMSCIVVHPGNTANTAIVRNAFCAR